MDLRLGGTRFSPNKQHYLCTAVSIRIHERVAVSHILTKPDIVSYTKPERRVNDHGLPIVVLEQGLLRRCAILAARLRDLYKSEEIYVSFISALQK